MKQYKIDDGQSGGFIQMVVQSMFIVSFFTFINTSLMVYQSIFYEYISFYLYVILIFGFIVFWVYVYYSLLYPSIIIFINRQAYEHKNLVKADILLLREQLDRIESKL